MKFIQIEIEKGIVVYVETLSDSISNYDPNIGIYVMALPYTEVEQPVDPQTGETPPPQYEPPELPEWAVVGTPVRHIDIDGDLLAVDNWEVDDGIRVYEPYISPALEVINRNHESDRENLSALAATTEATCNLAHSLAVGGNPTIAQSARQVLESVERSDVTHRPVYLRQIWLERIFSVIDKQELFHTINRRDNYRSKAGSHARAYLGANLLVKNLYNAALTAATTGDNNGHRIPRAGEVELAEQVIDEFDYSEMMNPATLDPVDLANVNHEFIMQYTNKIAERARVIFLQPSALTLVYHGDDRDNARHYLAVDSSLHVAPDTTIEIQGIGREQFKSGGVIIITGIDNSDVALYLQRLDADGNDDGDEELLTTLNAGGSHIYSIQQSQIGGGMTTTKIRLATA